VLTLDAVDDLGKMIPNSAERLSCHATIVALDRGRVKASDRLVTRTAAFPVSIIS
jgi:hypothetical protein